MVYGDIWWVLKIYYEALSAMALHRFMELTILAEVHLDMKHMWRTLGMIF